MVTLAICTRLSMLQPISPASLWHIITTTAPLNKIQTSQGMLEGFAIPKLFNLSQKVRSCSQCGDLNETASCKQALYDDVGWLRLCQRSRLSLVHIGELASGRTTLWRSICWAPSLFMASYLWNNAVHPLQEKGIRKKNMIVVLLNPIGEEKW